MDAVQFLKERERMCDSTYSCDDCPLKDFGILCMELSSMPLQLEDAVRAVEKWSEDHPENAEKNEAGSDGNV